jgi:hypothetical protein
VSFSTADSIVRPEHALFLAAVPLAPRLFSIRKTEAALPLAISGGVTGALMTDNDGRLSKQLLHLVFGGELVDFDAVQFSNINELDIVGIFPNYAKAYAACKAAAQRSVDNAHMRYFIVHTHRLLDPAAKSG